MKVMVILRADAASEAGVMPGDAMLLEMAKFNDELVNAGLMVAGEGLLPSARGRRVRFAGTERTVVDGPFHDTRELIAGFWIWRVKSMDEAVDWALRSPFRASELEIRPIAGEDLPDERAPDLRARLVVQR